MTGRAIWLLMLIALACGFPNGPAMSQFVFTLTKESDEPIINILRTNPSVLPAREIDACVFLAEDLSVEYALICHDKTFSGIMQLFFTKNTSDQDLLNALSIAEQMLTHPEAKHFTRTFTIPHGAESADVKWNIKLPLNEDLLIPGGGLDCTNQYLDSNKMKRAKLPLCPPPMAECILDFGQAVCLLLFENHPVTRETTKTISGIVMDFANFCYDEIDLRSCYEFFRITKAFNPFTGTSVYRGDAPEENAFDPSGKINRKWIGGGDSERASAILRWLHVSAKSALTNRSTDWYESDVCRSKLSPERCAQLLELAKTDPDTAAMLAKKWLAD